MTGHYCAHIMILKMLRCILDEPRYLSQIGSWHRLHIEIGGFVEMEIDIRHVLHCEQALLVKYPHRTSEVYFENGDCDFKAPSVCCK